MLEWKLSFDSHGELQVCVPLEGLTFPHLLKPWRKMAKMEECFRPLNWKVELAINGVSGNGPPIVHLK